MSFFCRRFNIEFRIPKSVVAFPDGPMLTHPMITVIAAQLAEAGTSEPLKALTDEMDRLYSENGYDTGTGELFFPTNIALIITAVA